MNGHRIIALALLVWIGSLIILFTGNPSIYYIGLNELFFFIGFIISVCIAAVGCEKLEKTGEDFDISKVLSKFAKK